jgi:hypothetical protein
MVQETAGLKVEIKWKLEKFEGDFQEGDTPVEVLEGSDVMSQEQFKELQNGFDKRGT